MSSAPSDASSGSQALRDPGAVSEHTESSSDLAAELAQLLGSFRSLISNAEAVFASVLEGSRAQDTVREQVSVAAETAQAYVKENPWRVMVIAAAASALIAYLRPRRR